MYFKSLITKTYINNNVYQTKHRQCSESSCIPQHKHPIINWNGHIIEHHNKDQLDN